ncbi:ATP-binding cassette domain-containing protein [Ignavigranum ruoffiae]|uniref:ABC transporter ATP-binding protein n=1 Tax=Ignavigranum ruoffiae TaxID=89093 RepID=UPI002064DA62|nr:ATP-binding cassette domain-containing protein [Ignavigranum ruoffiae]UPQ86221.1 ATP-binding cassette domain-containing protein [Ignavigranum ruoffiae]
MEIQLKNISKKFGEQSIFENLSATIPSGHSIGLIGPNGIGKTTLIRMMFNLDDQYQGQIFFDKYLNKDIRIYQRAYYMQDYQILYPQLTAYDHLKFLTDVHHIKSSRIEEVCQEVGMNTYLHKKTGTYSLGMKQHLLIAMALINQAECIVMDEPFNGLDPTSILDLKRILEKLRNQGKTILISSHNLALVQELVDQVFLIKDKKLERVFLDQEQALQLIFVFSQQADQSRFIQASQNAGLNYEVLDQGVKLSGDPSPYINLLINHQIMVDHVIHQQTSLEELYQAYYLQDK